MNPLRQPGNKEREKGWSILFPGFFFSFYYNSVPKRFFYLSLRLPRRISNSSRKKLRPFLSLVQQETQTFPPSGECRNPHRNKMTTLMTVNGNDTSMIWKKRSTRKYSVFLFRFDLDTCKSPEKNKRWKHLLLTWLTKCMKVHLCLTVEDLNLFDYVSVPHFVESQGL